ncbi:MAG: DUF262 domain-containing protein [Bacteroidetes bacterium]|jgi:uncharacterized protein with ParB-like and HNH nuclease domain|nr:DUF262 domain-containing protein [Bacteroidota bacterium]MBT6686528.1 DUF262 domain-containing protein [Bacteroidota bacterium]MBT7141751.1 DUF262 domain-containing protein [Bacteroidota bacterium]MBT7493460.1 DUF262 domain-containing protein [Bacteroidota bacterium]
MKNIFDTKTVSFQELIGNGKKYKIPEFQRDFSWKEENWEDLWQDLKDIYEDKETQHYMGAIVLQNTKEKKTFVVVDGQQRITTLSLYILAIVKNLKNLVLKDTDVENNKERIKKILDIYIGEKSISDLYYKSKLTLNENNDSFYQSRILEFKEPVNYAKLRDSEKLIYDAYIYFHKRLNKYFSDVNGEKLGKFLEKTLDGLTFIQITVDDDISAYTVFETLNARGVELTTTDLLKNYLFAIVAPLGKTGSEFKILKENWQQIVDIVGLKKFPVFLRFYLNSKQEIVRKERLFKEIKKEVKTPKQAIELIDVLKETAYLYAAILNPTDDFWSEHPNQKNIRQSLTELKLFGVSQPIPLLFAINKHNNLWLPQILKLLVSISFRYNVIGKLNPNSMEKVYNKISMEISNGEIINITQIKEYLNTIYINDDTFFNTFKAKTISTNGRNKSLVKYILTKIENQIANKEYSDNDSNYTIEHILPENYDEEWNEKFSNEADKYVYRLGNYSLLEEKKNRLIGNKGFNEKIDAYNNSQYKLSNNELNYEDWNISNLNNYQSKLAKFAKSIWKI